MEDEKKVAYVTREDFMGEIGVVWMFFALTFTAIMLDWDQVGLTILLVVSVIMAVGYMVRSRMSKRRRLRKRD